MKRYYWYKVCPSCNGQGRLIITENITAGKLYLHCEECEMGWNDPKKAEDINAGFLTLNENYETKNPTYEEICEYGWEEYAKHFFDED